MKENYTKQEVIDLVDGILQNPDQLIDAVQNENTDWSAEDLIDLAESFENKKTTKTALNELCDE